MTRTMYEFKDTPAGPGPFIDLETVSSAWTEEGHAGTVLQIRTKHGSSLGVRADEEEIQDFKKAMRTRQVRRWFVVKIDRSVENTSNPYWHHGMADSAVDLDEVIGVTSTFMDDTDRMRVKIWLISGKEMHASMTPEEVEHLLQALQS